MTMEHIIASITDPNRPLTANPWHINWNGAPCTVSSDGCRILLVKGNLPDGVVNNAESENIVAVLMRHEAKEFQHVTISSSAKLLEFGDIAGNCGRCGKICPACEQERDNQIYINYHGMPFNGHWIIEVIKGLPLSKIQISLADKVLRLEGEDWLYLQMGMFFTEGKIALMPKLEDFLA